MKKRTKTILKKAEQEVRTKTAYKEINKARVTIEIMADLMKVIDRDEEAITQAIDVCHTCRRYELVKKLEKLLEIKPERKCRDARNKKTINI